jgi:hypothetical protein
VFAHSLEDAMSDDAPKSQTGKKARPKRDPNRPVPKPKKRKGILVKAIGSGVVAILGIWLAMYSVQVGKAPWDWGEEERAGFKDFAQAQVEEAKENIENIDWGKLGEKTKKLWNDVPDLEAKLEAKLASLRAKKSKQQPAVTSPAEDGADGEATAGEASPAESDAFEQGCEAMRLGAGHYRKGVRDQAELRKARKRFEEAAEHFETAHGQARARGDQQAVQEIEGWMQENQTYLYDCVKLDKAG